MSRYRKALVAGLAGVLEVVNILVGEKLGLQPGWVESALAVLTPLLVFGIPNDA